MKIPSARSTINVVQQASGLATTGIIMIVGEADQGPDFTQEEDLADNLFGPNQIGEVRAKYGTGRIVDAFNGIAVPANDPQIQGAPAGIIIVKTNAGSKADATLTKFDDTDYGTLEDRTWGKLGNLISYLIEARTEEEVPTTGEFAIAHPSSSTNISVRVNGGTALSATLAALDSPATMAATIGALAGVDTTGAVSRAVLTNTTGTLAITVTVGNHVTIDRSIAFNNLPSTGDSLFIPTTSAMATSNAAAAGSYIVTGASSTQIQAVKVLDATGVATITPPTSKAATAIVGTSDVNAWSPLAIHLVESIDPLDGYGKNLQINQLTSGTDILASICYTLSDAGEPVAVDWISKTAEPHLIVSESEYSVTLTEARQLDNITNDISAGGTIALKLGYEGTTGSAVVDSTDITITTTGGSTPGTLAVALADFPSIADLASYINSFAGFTCTPGSGVMGSQPSTSLDQGTFGICSTFSDLTPGRIKQDAYKLFNTLANDGFLTELSEQADSGLPAPSVGLAFLTGGAKGATTNADIQAGYDALKMVRGNFLVPLFSRDAADDIADGQTDAASTYTIAAVHAGARSHVLQMSTFKKGRNRQAFLSMRDDFDDVKDAATDLNSARVSLTFQDVRDLDTNGNVTQFQPWMNSCKAAGMQAAGFYKAIFNKGINISGAIQAATDFNDQDDDAVEEGLDAGLLIVRRPEDGGFKYVSDQTTYGKDDNFVYNSIQAVYAADTIALTTAKLMEQAFVGQSLADVSASLALSTLEGIMENLRRLKLIAFSDDAPKGFKNAVIRISGPAMVVSVEVKAATALYFIPITFQVSQIQQSASS